MLSHLEDVITLLINWSITILFMTTVSLFAAIKMFVNFQDGGCTCPGDIAKAFGKLILPS